MDNVTVKCPQCGKTYVIPASGLGKKGRCKECNTVFTTAVNPDPPAELDELVQVVVAPALAPSVAPPAPKKGFFEKMNEWADKASRQVGITFVQGPWSINANSPATLVLEDDAMLLRTGIINKKEFSIPYEAITGVTVDTAERMTLTRVLLVGIFAFGMKKKDKFLKLDFADESGTNVSAIFGKAAGCDMQTLSGRILERKRERILRIQSDPVARVVEEPPAAAPATDIAATIENLARLRDQGILSENEFVAKKTELLSRL